MVKLTNITLSGYKSIEQMSLDLGPVNVLIGPNGVGKSNLVSFFRLLHEMAVGRLQGFIGRSGGADGLLFYSARTTPFVQATLVFEAQAATVRYSVQLGHAAPDTLVLNQERIEYEYVGGQKEHVFGIGKLETSLREVVHEGVEGAEIALLVLDKCQVFQFHDTSATSAMRRSVYIHDNRQLRHDGGNLAAVLYKLQQTQPDVYQRIVATIRQIAPWFGDYVLAPLELNPENVLLNWREERSDLVFGPHQMSDGTLRAMALITLLLQPRDDLPEIIVIDEPELGLHPYATAVVASLIEQAACHSQIILATQSTCLLDEFEARNVIVVDRDDRKSTFKRLEPKQLDEWLEDYSLSELWEKNVLGGGPA